MLYKFFFIPVFLLVFAFSYPESWTTGSFFYSTPAFNLIWFQSEEDVLLALRNGLTPSANTTIKLYSRDKQINVLKTDKNGILVLPHYEENEIVFSLNNETTLHKLQLFELERYIVKSRCFIENTEKSALLHGFFPTGEQNGEVTIELSSGKDTTKQTVKLQKGNFQIDLGTTSALTFARIFYNNELTGEYIIHTSSVTPISNGYPRYEITNIELSPETADSFSVRARGNKIPSDIFADIETLETAFDTIITPDQSGNSSIPTPDITRLSEVRGSIEYIFSDGKSSKGKFALPVLPGENYSSCYRIFYGELDSETEFSFFSPLENKWGAVVFYDNWIKEVKYININKGLNKIVIPGSISTKTSFSAAVISGCPETGINNGIVIKFNRKNAPYTNPSYSYTDFTEPVQTPVLLEVKNRESLKNVYHENNSGLRIEYPSYAGLNNKLQSNITVTNTTKAPKTISLQTFTKNKSFSPVAGITVPPNETVSSTVYIPVENNITADLFAFDLDELVYRISPRHVNTFTPYFSTLEINGIIIGDRTTKTAVNIPEKGNSSNINIFLSTDNRVLLIPDNFRNAVLKNYVFEEALFSYIKERLLTNKQYYPSFINYFTASDGGMKRFSDDTEGNIDTTLLFLYAAALDKGLSDGRSTVRAAHFIKQNLQSIPVNQFRTDIYNYIFNEKITSEKKEYYYNLNLLENDVLSLPEQALITETDSLIRKISAGLKTLSKPAVKKESVHYSIENTLNSQSNGTIQSGEIAGVGIELPENAVELLNKRTIDFSITKEGILPVYYTISGLFFNNDYPKAQFRIVNSENNTVESRLEKGNTYVISLMIPDKYKNSEVLIKIQNDLHSLFKRFVVNGTERNITNSNFIKPDAHKQVTIEIEPALDINPQELNFIVFPLLKN